MASYPIRIAFFHLKIGSLLFERASVVGRIYASVTMIVIAARLIVIEVHSWVDLYMQLYWQTKKRGGVPAQSYCYSKRYYVPCEAPVHSSHVRTTKYRFNT